MDKALIKIQKLEEELKELKGERLQTNQRITKLVETSCNYEYAIEGLEEKNIALNKEKAIIEENPKKRKELKQSFIKSIILSYIFVTIIALLPICIGNGGFSLVPACLASSTFLTALVSSIIVPVQFNTINKKYPLGNILEVENNILENDKEIELLSEKKKTVDKELFDFKELRDSLETKIKDIEKDIENLTGLRLKIIIDYCSNNLELDKKINVAYDNETKNKEKVK